MSKIFNTEAYDAYKMMVEGSKECKETLDFNDSQHSKFNNGVFKLISCYDDALFEQGSEANSLFSSMRTNYKKILAKGVDKKVSRRRLMKNAWDLCQLNVENPFEKEHETIIEKKEEIMEIKEEQVWQLSSEEELKKEISSVTISNSKPEIILGVIPEEEKEKKKKGRFKSFISKGE